MVNHTEQILIFDSRNITYYLGKKTYNIPKIEKNICCRFIFTKSHADIHKFLCYQNLPT